jgi:hypothetical protein
MFSFPPRFDRHLSSLVVLVALTYLSACGEAPTEPSSPTPSFNVTASKPTTFTSKPTVTVQKIALRVISFDGCTFHQFVDGIVSGDMSTTTWTKTDGTSWLGLKMKLHGQIVDQDGNVYNFGSDQVFSSTTQAVGTFQAYNSQKYRLISKGEELNEFLTFKSSLMLLRDGTYVQTSEATLACK